jgi:hypothetical protein
MVYSAWFTFLSLFYLMLLFLKHAKSPALVRDKKIEQKEVGM